MVYSLMKYLFEDCKCMNGFEEIMLSLAIILLGTTMLVYIFKYQSLKKRSNNAKQRR